VTVRIVVVLRVTIVNDVAVPLGSVTV